MRCRMSALTESLLRERDDIEEIFPADDAPEDFLDFVGGPDYFDDTSIYDSVDDATSIWLLNDWLDKRTNVGWEVHLELSKLLAARGHLIRARVESIVQELAKLSEEGSDFSLWAKYGLRLSFLEQMEDGELLAIQLLDQAPADFRDGLFRACYKLNTPSIYEAVKRCVRQWSKNDDSWGRGTGEAWAVLRMMERWDSTFPNSDHGDIQRICEIAYGNGG